MRQGLIKRVIKSILFYRKDAIYQIIIVALLSAIITGSLFTGYSVRNSLRRTASEKLGKTDILISSGTRYFDTSLADKISYTTGEKSVAILESDGYCQNFETGVTILNIKIYGINSDFFEFHESDSLKIEPGTVAINTRLSELLDIKSGDDLILNLRDPDPIPDNAPFAPSRQNNGKIVLKVGKILTSLQSGNFSLGVSQLEPMNVFVNSSDLGSGKLTSNRILIQNLHNNSDSDILRSLSETLGPSDIGLRVRRSEKTNEPEIISDRIFIDSSLVNEISRVFPLSSPVLTYLANTISVRERTTPYSFVSALPPSFLSGINEDEIIISRWLADDLNARQGDTIRMTWFYPGPGNLLEERARSYIVHSILDSDSQLSDPFLMPDFPGISGSTTCSGWDAGIPILLDRIRDKDEDYWNKYRGTPKAYISYKSGLQMWGNNFGTATAIRFPGNMDPVIIDSALTGKIDPQKAGFMITDIRKNNNRAAEEGIDFSSLFLSLGIFIIISCLILLSLAVTTFFDSRKKQIKTYFALGFRGRSITKMLFVETILLAFAGAIPGVFTGYLVNMIIINSLNSVWKGAVQTNTLSTDFSLNPVLLGFITTLIITAILLYVKLRSFLKHLDKGEKEELVNHSEQRNLFFLFLSGSIAIVLLGQSILSKNSSVILSFTGGSFLFIGLILLLRQYFLRPSGISGKPEQIRNKYSKQYFSFHPSRAVTPVIFIAAGIVAVIITGANRQTLTDKMLLPEGGTGGYLLWAESAVPVKENLNSTEGRREFGFDDEELSELSFVQAKRLPGDDASCLNLNFISAPPVLGIDPSHFISEKSFSFASVVKGANGRNPWSLLLDDPESNTVFGIADQTVLQWGLKIKTGDTLVFRTENGQPLNIVICAGLKSSVFQGYLLIGERNFEKYFPSIPGSSVFLINGNPELTESYREIISERLSEYGVAVETAGDKLASFFRVTNTYLDIFMVFGAFGMMLGVAGLAFILIRNFNQRKSEFALMMATGYSSRQIRKLILKDHIILLFWGILTGTFSGLATTLPSIYGGSEMPWRLLSVMVILIIFSGLSALYLSVRNVQSSSLIEQLRKE